MLFERQVFKKLIGEIQAKEITVITGMRRVGKTTAMRYLYDQVESKNKVFLDLENPINRKVFEEQNYDSVWNNLKEFGISDSQKAYLFLDEAQNLPELSRVAKYLYDHFEVKIFLTGSSSYYLRNLFPESLAGRKIVFELYPLIFSEFLVFKNVSRTEEGALNEKAAKKNKISHASLDPYYQEYIEFGGFPSVVLEESPERKRMLLSEIFTSYFEKDAKNLADFKDMSKLRDLILLLAPRVAARIEIQKLASELSLSRQTVYNYLSFLEQTYFISLLPRYSASIDRQAAGSNKLYFCDSGIVNVLGKVSQGQLFEQSVFQNLRGFYNLSYFSKDGASEIDFILDGNIALEVKLSFSPRDMRSLNQRSGGLSVSESYIVSNRFTDRSDAILAVDL
jgi:predicted AAA+ superfamily ATPase